MIDYEPWHPSHAPQFFERTDKSGRYNMLQNDDEGVTKESMKDLFWASVVVIAFAVVVSAMLYFSIGWEWN